MEIINQYHEIAAIFIARVFLGILFFFQGYDAIFNIKISNVIETYQNTFTNVRMPRFLIVLATWFTSYTELICGFLLIIGLFEYVALFLLGLNLIIAAIGFGINTAMWDSKYVFPRLVLILLLLIVPETWDAWSLDSLFFKY
ncbi:MAG: DoxX family protein [Bacteroidota bacterium]|nr:DoxX family protein [Bacteroidota bacterium]MDP3145855.1 DoxX family protein [Bacteroidota bacterium]MDP3558489.1 DoxX family protein [Bacteroidota bacterium]